MRTNDATRRTEGDVKTYVQAGESGLKGCEGEGGGGDVGEWSLVETMRRMIALEKERCAPLTCRTSTRGADNHDRAELIEAIGKVDRSKKSERDAITTKVETFRVQARLAMVAYGKHVPPMVVQAHNAAKKRLPNQASRLVWRNEDDDRACGLGAHPMALGVVPLDDEDLYGLNGSMENVGRYLPSKYHSVIRRHPAMAEAVAVERKLREGEANDALNTLRTLRDLRYAAPGPKHAHEVKEELGVNKKEDEAKVEYRRLRVLLRVLGMPEDDETYPAVRDEGPMQFVVPVNKYVLASVYELLLTRHRIAEQDRRATRTKTTTTKAKARVKRSGRRKSSTRTITSTSLWLYGTRYVSLARWLSQQLRHAPAGGNGSHPSSIGGTETAIMPSLPSVGVDIPSVDRGTRKTGEVG